MSVGAVGGGGLPIDAAGLRKQVAEADTDGNGQLEAKEAIDLGRSLGLDDRQATVLTGLTVTAADAEVLSRFAQASASHRPDAAIVLAREAMASGNPDMAFDALHLALSRTTSPADCIKLAVAAKELGVPLGEAAIARGAELTTRAADTVVLALAAHRLGLPVDVAREALGRGASLATTVGETLRVAAACRDLGLPMAANVLDQAIEQGKTVADCLTVAAAAVAGGHPEQAFSAAHKAASLAESAPALRELATSLEAWQGTVPSLTGLRLACLKDALEREAAAGP